MPFLRTWVPQEASRASISLTGSQTEKEEAGDPVCPDRYQTFLIGGEGGWTSCLCRWDQSPHLVL